MSLSWLVLATTLGGAAALGFCNDKDLSCASWAKNGECEGDIKGEPKAALDGDAHRPGLHLHIITHGDGVEEGAGPWLADGDKTDRLSPAFVVLAKRLVDRPNIHVLAWASDDVSRLRDFWLQQMKLMASCDDGAAYKISFGSLKIVGDLPPQRQKASKGFAFSADHMRAVQGKLAFANSTIAALPLDDIVLYTDLDVMPLQPYSRLLRWLTWNDLVLTHEPQPSITELHRFNGGLWLLRVSRATRALLHNWYATFLRNERLVSGEQAHLPDAVRQTQGLRIRQFPQVVVLLRSFPWRGGVAETRRCSDRGRYRDCEDLIAGTTVAYHAIALDHDRSLSRLSGERQKIVAMCRAGNMSRGWPVHMGWAARDEELRGVHRQAHVLHALARSTTSASRRDVCSLYYGTGAGVALRR